jgi:hypothetical protein
MSKQSVDGFHWVTFFMIVSALYIIAFGIKYQADRIIVAIESQRCECCQFEEVKP